MASYILSLDQGTTSSRAILFDQSGKIVGSSSQEFRQIYPKDAWVEHDPLEIWESQRSVAQKVISDTGVQISDIAGIGITNQRETTVLWNRETGEPICNALVWQDRRTASICDGLKQAGHRNFFRERTGLVIDAYFSGTKVKWILDNVAGARELANRGQLAFGTVDSWLIWKMTGGKLHMTDVTNASRTLLYNIHDLKWDEDILQLLDIPSSILPEVRSSSEIYGEATELVDGELPIAGIAGDQQAALFGQTCFEPGMVKNTYGTGCFILMNTGEEAVSSANDLLTTIAWQVDGKVHYALEGSVFIAGALVQWLRDELEFFMDASEIEKLAGSVEDNGGVYVIPAFVGLGAPYWDQYARGLILGLTRATNRGHISRAALEAIGFQSMDVIRAMIKDSGIELSELKVDGGATANDLLMQIQANISQVRVDRPDVLETTALGAAYLAGLATGVWKDLDELATHRKADRVFEPDQDLNHEYQTWLRALERSKDWINPEA